MPCADTLVTSTAEVFSPGDDDDMGVCASWRASRSSIRMRPVNGMGVPWTAADEHEFRPFGAWASNFGPATRAAPQWHFLRAISPQGLVLALGPQPQPVVSDACSGSAIGAAPWAFAFRPFGTESHPLTDVWRAFRAAHLLPDAIPRYIEGKRKLASLIHIEPTNLGHAEFLSGDAAAESRTIIDRLTKTLTPYPREPKKVP